MKSLSPVIAFTLIQCLLMSQGEAFTPQVPPTRTSELAYTSEAATVDSVTSTKISLTIPTKTIKPTRTTTGKKATVAALSSLDELKYFLEDDDRLVAIKFHAPWCKSCAKLGRHFDRLAKELGDCVVDRQKVMGDIRCAQVEYGRNTKSFITEQLQISSVPTLQLYRGLHKVWECSGMTDTRALKAELTNLLSQSEDELLAHAEEVDDEILIEAIEETLFDSPDFLNEEW